MPGPTTKLFRDVANRTRTFPQSVVKAASAVVEKELRKTAKQDTGGDSRMSGMGNARVSPKTEIVGSSAAVATIHPARRTTGMWAILDEGTQGHSVRARRGRLDRQENEGRARALRVGRGNEWAAGPWIVRGAPARQTWRRAIRAARPDIERVGREQLAKVVR